MVSECSSPKRAEVAGNDADAYVNFMRNKPRLKAGRSKNPFLNFVHEVRKSYRGQHVQQKDIVRHAGVKWRQMTDEEREPYRQAHKGKLHRKNEPKSKSRPKSKRPHRSKETKPHSSEHNTSPKSQDKSESKETVSRSSKAKKKKLSSDEYKSTSKNDKKVFPETTPPAPTDKGSTRSSSSSSGHYPHCKRSRTLSPKCFPLLRH